ncbi:MAG: large-conductance mechanosensitive channel protein MscL [Flavobacteriaceae bacterium]
MKLKEVLNTPFVKAFKKFISKGNVIELAVGLIMATYFGAIVKSLVNDIIMPPVGKLIGGVDFASFKYVIQPAVEAEGIAEIAVRYGMFVNTIITFLIVAFSIFLVVRFYNKIKDKFEAEEEEAPATPTTPPKEELLLTEIRDLLKKK